MKKQQSILLLVGVLVFLFGCQPKVPKEALSFTPETLQYRQMQTRTFETTDEKKILAASSAVLQDLGFNLDESETNLGVIVASKKRDATSAGQVVGSIVLAALTGVATPVDKEQIIRVSLVTSPHGSKQDNISVRITFQRVIINTQGQVTTLEPIVDAAIYQGFYEKLSKSVFLEANVI